MSAGTYGGVAWVELERQRIRREQDRRSENSICKDCPLFVPDSSREKCCGEQDASKP